MRFFLSPARPLAAAFVLSVAAVSGCASTSPDPVAADASLAEPIAARRAVLEVHGMSCPLCATNVGRSLEKVDGVESADVDLAAGRWAVTFEPGHGVTEADLARAVADAGFTFRGVYVPDGGDE